MTADTMTAEEILGIKVPEQLYTNDATAAKKEFRRLSMKWHPDRGGSHEVFEHVKGLYEAAVKKISDGLWIIPGVIDFTTVDNRKFQIRYKKHHAFELGDMYVSDTVVAYMIDKANADLVENSKRAFRSIKYANDGMKKEFSRYLPEVIAEVETADRLVIVYKKTPDLLLLNDVAMHFKMLAASGGTPPPHIAWILSSLYNLECFLSYCGLSHNAISPMTYFISPKHHSGAMLGGWWYSSKIGERLIALPDRTMDHCVTYLTDKKVMSSAVDLQLIKTIGLELLGDINGTSLPMKMKADPKRYPAAFCNWLRLPVEDKAVESYATYKNNVLISSWGPPKFHEMKLTAADLYKD